MPKHFNLGGSRLKTCNKDSPFHPTGKNPRAGAGSGATSEWSGRGGDWVFVRPLSVAFLQPACLSLLARGSLGRPRARAATSPSACWLAPPLWLSPEPQSLLSLPRHVANERPAQTSLGDQLGFLCSLKLIMSLSLVQFRQLMYLRIHKWLFVFNLSDMCVIVLSSPGTRSSLSFLLINSALPRAPGLSRSHPQGKLESRKGFMVEKLGSKE